jgi:outer membrane protein assembly factor BamB
MRRLNFRVFAASVVGVLFSVSLWGQESFDRLTFHAAPKALKSGASVADWPHFLGSTMDAHSVESPLLKEWPADGPSKVWEVVRGGAYTSPAVSGDRLVIFHSMDGKEVVECLHRETGQRFWIHEYPVEYQDRYGFANGPRASPTIADGVVVTSGVTSVVHALDLETGRLLWRHDLRSEFNVPQDFFGAGSSPLILNGRVILNVGGKAEAFDIADSQRDRKRKLGTQGVSVAAFDLKTGAVKWKVEDEWGASYASPVTIKLHGQTKVLVYAGGESDPATGGILCIDPESGELHDRFAWRSDDYIQAIGSSPLVIPDRNRAFVSTCYPKGRPLGGVMVEYDEKFKSHIVWKSEKLAIHWMQPVYHEGHIYAIDGERENNSRLVCVKADTGEEIWSEELFWEDESLAKRFGPQSAKLGILRASLLRVDGAFLCLGEMGSLLWLDLSPAGCKVLVKKQLFLAQQTWSLPVVSHGLLYIAQQAPDIDERKERVICYDLRAP